MKNIALSAILLSTVLLGASQVSAQEYKDATTAKVASEITFLKDDSPVTPVDPEDPDKPIDPDEPNTPNPIGGELMITYASNLNFGTHEKSGTSWNATADHVNGGTKVAPFVGIKDSRGTDRKGWVLTAKQDSPFTTSDGGELVGAELILSNLVSADRVGAPSVSEGKVVLSADAHEIALANADQGIGSWSVGLGKLQEEGTTNGVTLKVPATTAKDTAAYSTSVTWELTADPSAE